MSHQKPREPSAAEVDRLVAAGYANPPKWWAKAEQKQGRGETRRGRDLRRKVLVRYRRKK